jgi:hypothetical protein
MPIRCLAKAPRYYAILLLLPLTVAGCSQQTASSTDSSTQTESAIEQNYGNPEEMALVGLAHKKFPEEAIFTNEIISVSSGEKRICGTASFETHTRRYIFSLSAGLNQYPSESSWQHNCSNGWKPGSGY